MWVVGVEEALDGLCAVDGGIGKEGTVVVREACHDRDVVVESACSEELGGGVGEEVIAADLSDCMAVIVREQLTWLGRRCLD